MTTELNKPIEVNSPRQKDERYILVSQEMQPQEGGMDLTDLVIAAWKNRVLFIASWVLLATIIFAVMQAFGSTSVSTHIGSGMLAKTPVQTPDGIRDQLSTLFMPVIQQELEAQLQHPVSLTLTAEPIKKGSEYLKVTAKGSGLSKDELDTCMKSLLQKWLLFQTTEIDKSEKAFKERIALITQEIATSKVYADSLLSNPDPIQKSEGSRLLLQSESKKQQIFDLQLLIQNIMRPIVITPFNHADSGPGHGIKGVALSAFVGAVLACGVVFAASIIRTARIRLANG